MNHNIKFLVFCITIISFAFSTTSSSEEDSTSAFFSEIHYAILKDYQLCTGDSSIPSRKTLLKWNSDNSFIIESENYPVLLKKFAEETGIHPSDIRPCEIVNWTRQQLRDKNETSMVMEKNKNQIASRRADSIHVQDELSANPLKPYHFNNIPFGITRKGFQLLADRNELIWADGGSYFTIDSITICSQVIKGAFHFDKNDRFFKYELESKTASLDSLDRWIRPLADSLAAFMQHKIGTPPDHTYRIGRFDITQGRLAICKFWNLPDATIHTGLATHNYRYYAKLLVSSKPKLHALNKDTVQDIQKHKK